jgi:hypothetical protein
METKKAQKEKQHVETIHIPITKYQIINSKKNQIYQFVEKIVSNSATSTFYG